jgi:hypothetical protein
MHALARLLARLLRRKRPPEPRDDDENTYPLW